MRSKALEVFHPSISMCTLHTLHFDVIRLTNAIHIHLASGVHRKYTFRPAQTALIAFAVLKMLLDCSLVGESLWFNLQLRHFKTFLSTTSAVS